MITDLELINLEYTRQEINLGPDLTLPFTAYTNKDLEFAYSLFRKDLKLKHYKVKAPSGTEVRIGQVTITDYNVSGHSMVNGKLVYFSTIVSKSFIELNMYKLSSKVDKIEIPL